MDGPPLPQAIWDSLSPDAQAAVAVLVQSFEQRIADRRHLPVEHRNHAREVVRIEHEVVVHEVVME